MGHVAVGHGHCGFHESGGGEMVSAGAGEAAGYGSGLF